MNNGDSLVRGTFEPRVQALAPGLDAIGLPACVLDTQLRYRYVNDAYAALSGRTRGEFIGRTPDEVFHRIPQDDRRHHLRRALAGETSIFNRRTMEGPNAGRWSRAHYFPLRGVADEVIGVMVLQVDVQQLKDAEAALADRERQLSLIMDSVGFPVTYVDRARVIRFANRPSREWSSRTAETMIGQDIAAVMTPE